MVFTGLVSGEKQSQTYACLYGVHRPAPDRSLPANFSPVIPISVSFYAMAQLLLSITLITLFLLALRSQFRIR